MGKPIEGLSRRELLELGAAGAALALITGAAACDSDETNEPPSAGERSPPARLTGRVVRPRDPGYPRARADWDKLFTAYPLAIVFARSVRDVVNALTWSQQNGVAVRVRSGRHHLAGWSNLDGGLVIDVSELKAVRIDSAARTATVGAGLTQGEIVEALGKRGRAVPVGSEGTVGLAGATLGGGFGFLTRSLGMSCDSLIGADVVVASGSDGAKTIRADEKRNPDLLWALRGAGNGNFGIVTSFTYRLHPLRKATFLSAKWNGLRDLPVVFDAWQRQAPGADRRLTSVVEVGGDAIQLFALLSEGSPAEARRLLAPVLRHGKPEVMAEASTWPKVFAGLQSPRKTANWLFASQFVTDPFPAKAIGLVGRYMADSPAPPSNFFCSSFGGAVEDAPPGGSAFPHRDALFYAEPSAGWNGASITPRAETWIAEFNQALRPYVSGAYVNVPTPGMADWETAYWGKNYPRLRDVKAKYDPDNVFQYEQSIAPA